MEFKNPIKTVVERAKDTEAEEAAQIEANAVSTAALEIYDGLVEHGLTALKVPIGEVPSGEDQIQYASRVGTKALIAALGLYKGGRYSGQLVQNIEETELLEPSQSLPENTWLSMRRPAGIRVAFEPIPPNTQLDTSVSAG